MELNVLNIKGEETGRKVTLDDAIFGIEPNDHAIYLDVKSHMANRRSGTAKTKERSENAHEEPDPDRRWYDLRPPSP